MKVMEVVMMVVGQGKGIRVQTGARGATHWEETLSLGFGFLEQLLDRVGVPLLSTAAARGEVTGDALLEVVP